MTPQFGNSPAGPALLVRTPDAERSLSAGRSYYVGRDPQSDIVVNDSRVSWRHAVRRVTRLATLEATAHHQDRSRGLARSEGRAPYTSCRPHCSGSAGPRTTRWSSPTFPSPGITPSYGEISAAAMTLSTLTATLARSSTASGSAPRRSPSAM